MCTECKLSLKFTQQKRLLTFRDKIEVKKLILYSKTNIDYKKRKRAKTYREDQTKENANKINFDHPSTNNIKLNTTRTKPSSLHITAKNLLKIELTQRMDHKTKHKSFMNINSLKNSNVLLIYLQAHKASTRSHGSVYFNYLPIRHLQGIFKVTGQCLLSLLVHKTPAWSQGNAYRSHQPVRHLQCHKVGLLSLPAYKASICPQGSAQ